MVEFIVSKDEELRGVLFMKFCANCGTQLDDQAQWCHNCGAQQAQQAYFVILPDSLAVLLVLSVAAISLLIVLQHWRMEGGWRNSWTVCFWNGGR